MPQPLQKGAGPTGSVPFFRLRRSGRLRHPAGRPSHGGKRMLQAIGLTKRYEDGLLALDHLDLTVADGELFCLLGANGAGKTTTINLFLNFLEPTSGQALVDGIDATREPLR